jgi:hypothetical protein
MALGDFGAGGLDYYRAHACTVPRSIGAPSVRVLPGGARRLCTRTVRRVSVHRQHCSIDLVDTAETR